MKTLAFGILLIFLSASALGQDIQNIRKYEYARLGVGLLGAPLDPNLTPFENVSQGRFGARVGFALEAGKQYYFQKKSLIESIPSKIGMEWLFFNHLGKPNWDNYHRSRNEGVPIGPEYKDGVFLLAGLGVGPVVSVNPWELVIIDVQACLMGVFSLIDLSYAEHEGTTDERYIEFYPAYEESGEESAWSHFTKHIGLGVMPNFGITVRRKGLGLSWSYVPGRLRTRYESDQGVGKASFPVSTNRLMLSLSFIIANAHD